MSFENPCNKRAAIDSKMFKLFASKNGRVWDILWVYFSCSLNKMASRVYVDHIVGNIVITFPKLLHVNAYMKVEKFVRKDCDLSNIF